MSEQLQFEGLDGNRSGAITREEDMRGTDPIEWTSVKVGDKFYSRSVYRLWDALAQMEREGIRGRIYDNYPKWERVLEITEVRR